MALKYYQGTFLCQRMLPGQCASLDLDDAVQEIEQDWDKGRAPFAAGRFSTHTQPEATGKLTLLEDFEERNQ